MATPFLDPAELAAFREAKLTKIGLHASAHMFCDVYCLLPGQAQKIHAHAGSDKIYCQLTGTAKVTIGEEQRVLEPNQVAVAAAGVAHGVENVSVEPCTLLVVMAPAPAPH